MPPPYREAFIVFEGVIQAGKEEKQPSFPS